MLEIFVDADEEWDSSCSWERLVREAAQAAVAESAFPQLATSDRAVELSVRLTGDREVQALNSKWRGKDKPTNVLSFPLLENHELDQTNIAGPEMLLGDIVLAGGFCKSEAEAQGVTFESHASHLVIHGTLHLLGYDHHEDEEAADMEAREIRALSRIGISNPYRAIA